MKEVNQNNRGFLAISLFVLVIILSYNILLTVFLRKEKVETSSIIRDNSALLNTVNFQKKYITQNITYFNLSKNSIISIIGNFRLVEMEDSTFFVILEPKNVCSACINSLYAELLSFEIDLRNFFLISETSNILSKKEWIANSFLERNYFSDNPQLFINNIFNEQIVIMKISNNLDRYDIIGYEPGLNYYLELFIETSYK